MFRFRFVRSRSHFRDVQILFKYVELEPGIEAPHVVGPSFGLLPDVLPHFVLPGLLREANEYQPDNAFTLVRYLSREQYGSAPLIYGQYYGAPYDLKTKTYWAPLDGKYKKVEGPIDARYSPSGKMLFPRMWSTSADGSYERFYETYTGGKGRRVAGATARKPTMGANLLYFFDYQLHWMYWRYFMWNFVGRQNQIHAPNPGDIFHGNWESGVKFIDDIRLGDQVDAPDVLAHDKGKNHYYFLPLLLGLLGLFFQFDRDKRGCWLTFLMFFSMIKL